MRAPGERAASAGWFGKIRALGDFVTRGLPLSFVTPWDEWLSVELREARARLAEQWPVTYRDAPIWCFVLGAGVIDDRAWHGILMPSYDRVGREFPLTVAQSRPPRTAGPREPEWWAYLVETSRRALESGCSADELDRALVAFFTDDSPEFSGANVAAGSSGWWMWHTGALPDEPVTRVVGLPRGEQFNQLLARRPTPT
jgi:type VI secretion system protein ImpM